MNLTTINNLRTGSADYAVELRAASNPVAEAIPAVRRALAAVRTGATAGHVARRAGVAERTAEQALRLMVKVGQAGLPLKADLKRAQTYLLTDQGRALL